MLPPSSRSKYYPDTMKREVPHPSTSVNFYHTTHYILENFVFYLSIRTSLQVCLNARQFASEVSNKISDVNNPLIPCKVTKFMLPIWTPTNITKH